MNANNTILQCIEILTFVVYHNYFNKTTLQLFNDELSSLNIICRFCRKFV